MILTLTFYVGRKTITLQLRVKSSRAEFLRPLTPPYMPFGIRRFNSISKHVVSGSNPSD